tara:strand:+ start:142 stop:354 length:213 start_codon:yes stop_codon:yes gene_type:complete
MLAAVAVAHKADQDHQFMPLEEQVVAETLQTQTEILEQQTQAAAAVAALTLELEAAADQASLSFVMQFKE